MTTEPKMPALPEHEIERIAQVTFVDWRRSAIKSFAYKIAEARDQQWSERVQELELALVVVSGELEKWQSNGGVKSGYEFIDAAITIINAALSKEQGK